jgi:hypothetical protein
MPAQYLPYSVSRNSRETHRNWGDTYSHTRSNNARPFTSQKSETGQWPTLKGHLVVTSGEFVRTTLFLFAFDGTQVASMASGNKPIGTSGVLFIALSFGFSLTVNAWAFYRIGGGLFNPAVSEGSGSIEKAFTCVDSTPALYRDPQRLLVPCPNDRRPGGSGSQLVHVRS